MASLEFAAKPAHADMPDDQCGEAHTATTKGRYDQVTLRGMLDSGCYPNMRRSAFGLSNQSRVNIQVRVAKQGVGSIANICGRIVIDSSTTASNGNGGLRTLVLPDFEHDLWSIYEITRAGYTAVFNFDGAKLYRNNAVLIHGAVVAEEQVDHERRQYYMSLPVKVFSPDYEAENDEEAKRVRRVGTRKDSRS